MFCQWLIGYIKLILNAKTDRKTDIFLDEIEFGKKNGPHTYTRWAVLLYLIHLLSEITSFHEL